MSNFQPINKRIEMNYGYGEQVILNMQDHAMLKLSGGKLDDFYAYELRKLEGVDAIDDEFLLDFMKENESSAISHPWSNGKVLDYIHPSMYCYVDGKSLGNDGKVFVDTYETHNIERRPGYFLRVPEMKKSTSRWLPTIFNVKKASEQTNSVFPKYYYDVTQKSYINGLFDQTDKFTEGIFELLCISLEMFDDLASNMAVYKNDDKPKLDFYGRDIQVMVKLATYILQPGESHEGIWHVEGMPDEHIIMSSIYYIEDDIGEAKLQFRRDRGEDEMDLYIEVPDQNAETSSQKYINQNIGNILTEDGYMYAWVNACQHRLSKITNKTDKQAKRSFLAFFLVDPDVKIISTEDIPAQNDHISAEESFENMRNLMKERKSLKIKLNEHMTQTISYCEH